MSTQTEVKDPKDPMRDLALQIYVGLACHAYGDVGGAERARPQPKALAQLSFKLAEAFQAADGEFNPITIAAAAATKSAAKFNAADLDLGSLHKPR
ncbi:MAG TPA: hypothetical protein VI730_10105 [Burkholderiales bacterium]|nr:hypothetical protein [Burkholderiales bacterium]